MGASIIGKDTFKMTKVIHWSRKNERYSCFSIPILDNGRIMFICLRGFELKKKGDFGSHGAWRLWEINPKREHQNSALPMLPKIVPAFGDGTILELSFGVLFPHNRPCTMTPQVLSFL